MSMRKFLKPPGFDWGYLIVLGLTLPVLWPLVEPAYLSSHDGLHHLYRLVDLDWCIRGGVLYPRWLPNLGFGYGYAVLNYYAPVSYYIAEILHIFGAGFIDSIKLTYALGFLGSGLAMYLFAKEHIRRISAILASAVYVYLPYHLADGYVRGALAEFLSFAFFPLILWCFYKLITLKRFQYVAWSALSLGGLIITHNLMALIFGPLLVAYIGFVWFEERDLKTLGYVALALVLALGFGTFYWLPGFAESKWARLGMIGPQAADYIPKLITMSDFFSPFVIYRYFPEQGVWLQHPIGWLQFGLICLSLVVPFRLRHQSWVSARRHLIFFHWATFVSLFMLFVYSRPLWDHIPLLSYLQYPFRFLTVTSFTSAFVIGSIPLLLQFDGTKDKTETAWSLGGRVRWPVPAISVIILALMVTSLPRLPIEPMYLPEHEEPLTEGTVDFATMAEYDYLTGLWARLWGGVWMMEYLPAWVEEEPGGIFLPVEKPTLEPRQLSAEDVPAVTVGNHGPLSMQLEVDTLKPVTLSFHSFYVPNWETYIDGRAETPYPLGSLGLLAVDVAAGQHQLMVRFGSTPAERAGTVISALSLSAVVAVLVLTRQRKALLAALLISLLLVLAGVYHIHSAPSTRRPTSVEANLGNQFKLLGYYLHPGSYRAGDTMSITLYWLALQEMGEDYKVFVHLTDEADTRLVAQSDRWPVYNFSPTTRWEPGEVVWDRHEIQIPAGEGPGTYRLWTGAYVLATMQNLDVLDRQGNSLGVKIPLSAVQVSP